MKVKISAPILALASLVVCLIPAPISAATLTMSPSQGIVGTEVTLPSVCSYGDGNYYLYWGESKQLLTEGAIDEGCVAITFIVPEAARGEHKVTLKLGEDSFDNEFTVLPSISLNTDHGTVRSELTVTGKGFGSNESAIQIIYDDSPVGTGIEASSKGSWQSSISIPSSNGGEHIIDAEGATPAADVDDQTFTVTPQIKISPTSGWVSAMASIVGTGFGSNETNIVVTYDGLAAKTGITSDAAGSWQASFSIPTSTKGSHKVDAYGAVTAEADVPEVSFSVSPGIKLELTSGHLGDAIHAGDILVISGVGFEANEAGIQSTFDGTLVISGITADAKGSWSAQLEVPQSTNGPHTIDASGNTTEGTDVADATIIISPQMTINPATGAIGANIAISGTGFGSNQLIAINYAGSQIDSGSTTDARGSFTTSFEIPKSQAGDYTITVTDGIGAVASASFSVESTPPPTPHLISPEAGSRIGFIGNTTVTFDWSDVEDPSGVGYILEISQNADFSGSMVRKEDLSLSQYTLTDAEAITKGDYYWRVKAIDGAGNESEWTSGQLLRVGVMELWQLIASIIAGLIIIAIIVRVVRLSRRGGLK